MGVYFTSPKQTAISVGDELSPMIVGWCETFFGTSIPTIRLLGGPWLTHTRFHWQKSRNYSTWWLGILVTFLLGKPINQLVSWVLNGSCKYHVYVNMYIYIYIYCMYIYIVILSIDCSIYTWIGMLNNQNYIYKYIYIYR